MKAPREVRRLLSALPPAGTNGPGFTIAYAVGAAGEDASDVGRALMEAAGTAKLPLSTEPFVDADPQGRTEPPLVAATRREQFRAVLEALSRWNRPARADQPKQRARARDRLALAARLLDGVLADSEAPIPELPADEPEASDLSAEQLRGYPLVAVRRLGDLGSRADSIAKAIAELLDRQAHLVVFEEEIDTRTASGRSAIGAILTAEEAGRRTSRLVVDARIVRRRREGRAYAAVPFGFRRDDKDDSLIPVPEDLAIVQEMRELQRDTRSAQATAATLNAKGRAGSRHRPWSARAVLRIVKNPIYDEVTSP